MRNIPPLAQKNTLTDFNSTIKLKMDPSFAYLEPCLLPALKRFFEISSQKNCSNSHLDRITPIILTKVT